MLKKHGAKEGSTIVMTPTAFMTEEAWKRMTPSLVKGLRAMPIVEANPQWWMLEIFDGFGPHLSSLAAMEIRHENKILSMKEEGDSSHVNQAYDKFVAMSDKVHKRECLGMLRNAKHINSGVIDQYGLLHASLYTIRATTKKTWTSSFQACNLDPLTRVSFPEWCQRIGSFLQTGQTFKCETLLDKYSLLPTFWHGTTPEDKKLVVEVISGHDISLTKHKKPELVKRLEDKINGPNDPATAEDPMLEEEGGEGGAGVKSGDEEGSGHVWI
jgi:hypothetical protein